MEPLKPFGKQQGQVRVPVRRSVLQRLEKDPGALVAEIYSATLELTGGAIPGADDVPLAVRQLFQAEHYRRQVISAGHSGFIAAAEQDLSLSLADIGQALQSSGADAHLALFDQMQTWVALNPEDAEDLTEDEPALVALDAPFRALELSKGLSTALGRWTALQPVLKPVAEADWSPSLRALAHSTPTQAVRHKSASLAAIARALSDPARLGFGMAAASQSRPDPVVHHGPCVQLEVGPGGDASRGRPLQTISGLRIGLREAQGFSLYEAVPNSGDCPGLSGLRTDRLDDFLLHHPHSTGRRLAHVSMERVKTASRICKALRAPAAIHALLEALPQPASATCISVHAIAEASEGGPGLVAMIVADQASRAFAARITEKGAVLLSEPSHESLVTLSRDQIEAAGVS
ncbi:hypothetical protein R3X27_21670 [Tropicimonas sp. TH_r6]|uniref:DMP19 family protein n=1 Tax=Tropicimonas sp. TH_r6 TaxID=3082085 RepID=UPI0029532BDF|nr:hypothetical protein [Tropicimonas sp. TH_r6]MDV7145301.1 hypothetical protein [Tropicimonas sp. TH_r6]